MTSKTDDGNACAITLHLDTAGADGVAEIDHRLPSLRAAHLIVRGILGPLPAGPLRDELEPQIDELSVLVMTEPQGEYTLAGTLPDGRHGAVAFMSWHRGTCDDEARRRAAVGAAREPARS